MNCAHMMKKASVVTCNKSYLQSSIIVYKTTIPQTQQELLFLYNLLCFPQDFHNYIE